jgi:hypothetical protein
MFGVCSEYNDTPASGQEPRCQDHQHRTYSSRNNPLSEFASQPKVDTQPLQQKPTDQRAHHTGEDIAQQSAASDNPTGEPACNKASPDLGSECLLVNSRKGLPVDADPDWRAEAGRLSWVAAAGAGLGAITERRSGHSAHMVSAHVRSTCQSDQPGLTMAPPPPHFSEGRFVPKLTVAALPQRSARNPQPSKDYQRRSYLLREHG